MCTSARPRSYSYMPDSNMPLTVKRRMRGTTPAGVAVPCGAMTTTDRRHATLQLAASALPRMIRYFPGSRSSMRPLVRCAPMPVALRSSSGSTPRRWRRRFRAVCEHRLRLDVRHRGLTTPGCFEPPAAPGCQSGRSHRRPGEGGVRGDAEHAGAQLALEAVHDRQHDDQRRHAQHQAEHRHQRDERHEAAPVRRAQVARADQPFVGSEGHAYS